MNITAAAIGKAIDNVSEIFNTFCNVLIVAKILPAGGSRLSAAIGSIPSCGANMFTFSIATFAVSVNSSFSA